MSNKISCGIIFIDTEKEEMLMVHPTNQKNYWDFPKGGMEIGESPLETAIREVEEESGIIINETDNVHDLGKFSYNSKKDINLFYCFNKQFDIEKLVCSSMVIGREKVFPECDDFKMFSFEDAVHVMCPSMKKVFIYEYEQLLKRKINEERSKSK